MNNYIKEKSERAVTIFRNGHNCTQAVLMAFREETGISDYIAERIAAPFGVGFGAQREICGAVTGMGMVVGMLSPFDKEQKDKFYSYKVVKELSDKFKESHSSIICREILNQKSEFNIDGEKYFAKTRCEKCVEDAARKVAEIAFKTIIK